MARPPTLRQSPPVWDRTSSEMSRFENSFRSSISYDSLKKVAWTHSRIAGFTINGLFSYERTQLGPQITCRRCLFGVFVELLVGVVIRVYKLQQALDWFQSALTKSLASAQSRDLTFLSLTSKP